MATARDVAQLAGTSTAVVSYVFNDGPRGVAPATRERVLQAARELGYQPNMMARALRAGRTRSIGLLVPDICNPYFTELARAIEDRTSAAGNLLLIADAALSPEQEARHCQAFIERQVDSVIMISVSDNPEPAQFTKAGIPVVVLHPVADHQLVSSLTIDYVEAAALATGHLLEHGYSSIALLNGPTDSAGSLQHARGFAQAIATSDGIEATTWRSAISRHEAARVAAVKLAAPGRPRAVYCTTDEQAFGVLFAAYDQGLRVPEDVAVIGFDGTANSAVSIPPLTTIQQPRAAYVDRAIAILDDLSAQGGPHHEVLTYDFVIRRSCGCAGT
ncbi:MAG: LacI family transcriptional regulator [Kribbellaceae bacterium]|nr:LacI family transcriptional regulator [Kribbellaceae bacterium]